jgi:hypothetical protein
MASVRELIEAGQPPRENERALVVVDEAAEPELELSFYDYQQGRFISPQGLTGEPHFFRTTLDRIGGKAGYLVGPEVTRFLRHRALIGIASRNGPLGDVPSDVRTYRLVEQGATIDIPEAKQPEVAKEPEIRGGVARGLGDVGSNEGRDVATGALADDSGQQSSEVGLDPERAARRRRRLAYIAGLAALLLIVAVPFALARMGWYGLVVGVNGSLDFTQNKRQSASEPLVFTPQSTRIEIRRALWVRPFEGWWINKKPPAQIEVDRHGWWLSKKDRSPDHAVTMVLQPNASALSTATGRLRSQLTFRNTDTGQVFGSREATVQLVALPVGQLHFEHDDAVVFAGFKGGSFKPGSAQIKLSATGADVRWSAQDIPSWIRLSGGPTGVLKKDSSVTLIAVPQAENLAPGTYEGRLTFRNDETKKVAQKAARLIVLDVAVECDRRAGSRFDPDRPATAPFVADVGTLSDDDLDLAIRICAAAFQADSSAAGRRFIAGMGRAYAARAVRLAKSGAGANAHTAMNDAVRLWQEAAKKGSTAAMSFLGSYWTGLYDNEVNPPSDKCQSAPPRFSFTAEDTRKGRDYWEQAAKASPPNPEAMANYGWLLVTAPDRCPPQPGLQNISEGISWLKQAVDRGNLGAAETLGELFYRGRAPSSAAPNDRFPKNVGEGLRWLAMACRAGNTRAKQFVTRMISTKAMDPAKRPPGC